MRPPMPIDPAKGLSQAVDAGKVTATLALTDF
jgi:hypothetical protein